MVIGAGTVILSYLPACAIGPGFVGEITVRQVMGEKKPQGVKAECPKL